MIRSDQSTELLRGTSHLSSDNGLKDEQQHRLVALLDSYLVEMENGRSPDREQLIAANPDLEVELREALESIDLLQRFELPTSAPLNLTPSNSHRVWEKPQRIGPYDIGEELGRGAMGVVYSATLRSTQTEVAIKVLLGTWSREKQRIERFQREARAAESLNHPNIIPVYDIGNEDGHYFYTMKRIEGESLSQFISGQPRNPTAEDARFKKLAAWFAQVADALHAAHASGIVHRDVKPSNLLIDEQDHIWITDFGLAQIDDGATLTRSGDLVGTFQYMSPEQASGRPETVDRRTDIYSLGVTMFETFTGRQPFAELEAAQLIQAIRTLEPHRPRYYTPAIPIELETIIQRAMRPDKADRYSSALELAEDLNRFANGEKVLATRVTLAERLTRWSANHAGLVMACLVIAVGCVAALSLHNVMIQHERSKTFAELTRGDANYRQARAAVDTLGMQVADRLMAIPGAEAIRQDVLAETLNYYESFITASNNDPRLTADVAQTRLKIARLIHLAGNSKDAIAAYDNALQALRQAWSKQTNQSVLITLIQSLNELAVLHSEQGSTEEASENLREAVSWLPRVTNARERTLAEALIHNNMGVIAVRSNQPSQAVVEAKHAVALLSELAIESDSSKTVSQMEGSLLHLDLADALGNLSVMLSNGGNDAEASKVAEESLRIRRSSIPANNSPDQLRRLALAYNNLAALDWRSGKVKTAIQAYQSSVQLLESTVEKAPGQTGPRRELAVTLNNLGMALSSVPSPREAEAAFRRAIAIASAAADADPKNADAAKRTAGIWNNLAVLHEQSQDRKQADIAYRKAIEYQKTVSQLLPSSDVEKQALTQFEKNLRSLQTIPDNRSVRRDN